MCIRDSYLESAQNIVEDDDIGMDGVVFTYNDIALQDELGATSHHPRYKMVFKWAGETAQAKIKEVKWATSRLGIVTPVAVIEPVFLSGAEITNISLHNAAYVQSFNLKSGDLIELIRSGEVIPKFLRVVKAQEGQYAWPKKCSSCHSSLEFDDVRLRCLNQSCPAQQIGRILNWIRCVGIDDLSEKRLLVMMEQNLVETIPDLYALTVETLLTLPQTKEKLAQKLYENIQTSRDLPLEQFLSGLGIAGTGATTWSKLLDHHPSLEDLWKANTDQIAAIDGFAEKSAEQIVAGLKETKPLVKELWKAGVKPQEHIILSLIHI